MAPDDPRLEPVEVSVAEHLCHGINVVFGHKHAGLAWQDGLQGPARGRRDHRTTGRLSLDGRDAELLTCAMMNVRGRELAKLASPSQLRVTVSRVCMPIARWPGSER